MAEASNVVDIYDWSTWGGVDFEPVLDIVHQQIAPHANHQQRRESRMKAFANQLHTGMGKDCRNACNIIHYYFTQEHNKSAKDLKPDVSRRA
jgi:hypothetical protein